ncbi:sporulation protein YpjB [Paenibacillus marinisediminis]
MQRYVVAILLAVVLLLVHGTGAIAALQAPTVQSMDEEDVKSRWEQVDMLSESLYQLSVVGDVLKGIARMADIEALLSDRGMFDHMRIEQVKAISDSVIQVKNELHRVQIQPQKLMHMTSRLRLAVDAITHPKKPMWLQYDKVLHQEMSDMLQAETKEQWIKVSSAWMEHVDRILPAVTMQRPIQTVEMMSSLVALVKKTHENQAGIDQAKAALRDAEEVWMRALFGHGRDQTTWAHAGESSIPWKSVMWLACIVSVTLAYVGYIKYQHRDDEMWNGPWGNISQ